MRLEHELHRLAARLVVEKSRPATRAQTAELRRALRDRLAAGAHPEALAIELRAAIAAAMTAQRASC